MLKHHVDGKTVHSIVFNRESQEFSFVEHSGRRFTYIGIPFDTFNELTNCNAQKIEDTFNQYRYSGLFARIE